MKDVLKIVDQLDYTNITAGYFAEKILDKAVGTVKYLFSKTLERVDEKAKKELKKQEYETFLSNIDLSISADVILKQIALNLKINETWSKDISFNLATKSKELAKLFVDIDLYLSPLKTRYYSDEKVAVMKSSKLLEELEENVLIYGGPGAGKTTLMKNICRTMFSEKLKLAFTCPFVIRFRDLDLYTAFDNNFSQCNLYALLLNAFGIVVSFPEKHVQGKFYNEYNQLVKLTILEFLQQANMLLIFDGFDEIPYPELKHTIERDFESLALSLNGSKFILTTRSGDFKIKLTNTKTLEICPLNDSQIKKLISNWLNKRKEAEDLFTKIKTSPYYDTTLRPLTLSHLCAIYERRKSIPAKPRYVYDLVIQLLLELWDEERGIVRYSNYAEFYIEKKKEFLAHLAYCLTVEFRANDFSSDELRRCYNKIHRRHSLPASQAKKVVNEIESHSGIIVQSGYDLFQFSHKSLQEYLTGKYIFSLPVIPDPNTIHGVPNELAIATSLCSSPNSYFGYFLRKKGEFKSEFWDIFLARLIEERPDFDEDPIILVFFILMMNESGSAVFKETFLMLMETTNVRIAIPAFFNFYKKIREFTSQVTFEHKHLSTPLDVRNNLPGRLIIDLDIYQLIKPHG
ncbi:NACHT domain-containing protein [Mucilaginibacter sp. PAMB04168]|uniref:NACHT domain-containing protein n=1 Tax=Mucilaginibacter sp. PAMB04168 TaxID=3138567 RepID=UPI0031F68947